MLEFNLLIPVKTNLPLFYYKLIMPANRPMRFI